MGRFLHEGASLIVYPLSFVDFHLYAFGRSSRGIPPAEFWMPFSMLCDVSAFTSVFSILDQSIKLFYTNLLAFVVLRTSQWLPL